jgi:D-inositol-3-phosphate glycosyltransferase
MLGIINSPELNPERQTDPQTLVGSQVAGREFVRHLIRWWPEEVAICVPSTQMAGFQRELTRYRENLGMKVCATLVEHKQILRSLGQSSMSGLYDASGPYLHRLAYLREYAPTPIPIMGTTHGLSQQFLLWEFFARLVATPTLECDSIICTSEAARQVFHNLLDQTLAGFREAGFVCPNPLLRLDKIPLGVDTELFRPREREPLRSLLGLPKECIILCMFGRVDPASKMDIVPLLKIFQSLLQKYNGVSLRLLIAGNIPINRYDQIKKMAQEFGCADQIIWRLQPSLNEAPLYYSACDIFISLSDTLQESFGLAPLEAVASGLPVVVSDWSGYRETVLHGVTGFRIPTYWMSCDQEIVALAPISDWSQDHLLLSQSIVINTDALYQALDSLIGNPALRYELGSNAYKHVVANYSWQNIIKNIYELFQELSSIAQKLTKPALSNRTLLCPQYFQNFHHFATKVLEGEETLMPTLQGRELERSLDTSQTYPDLQPHLHFALIKLILRSVRLAQLCHIPLTLRTVIVRLSEKFGLPLDTVTWHLMWLLKHDYLKIAHVSSNK